MSEHKIKKGTIATKTASRSTIAHINVPPSQTWNYLRVNDISFGVPTPDAKGKVFAAVPRLFDAIETGGGTPLAHWIAEASGDGNYVEVPRFTSKGNPIVIEVGPGAASNTAIMVREGATANIVVVATAHEQEVPEASTPSDTSAALTRIFVEKNAHVKLTEVVATDESTQHLENVGIHAEDGATVNVRQYALGGSKVAYGIAVDLAGERSRFNLVMRYHVSGTSTLDVNHLCRQQGPHTRAEIHASGVLADSAHKTLRETIDLVHGGKDSKGNEAETVLVTGDDVVNKTLPVILCDEEDVQGNHGATIGSISQEQLDYLATRGLSEQAAESLFVRAIFDDAIINAPESLSRNAAVARASLVLGSDVSHDLVEGLGIELTDERSAHAAQEREA